ncbi:MAG TPA: S8 family serine peptidase [Actinomycetota bacterium]
MRRFALTTLMAILLAGLGIPASAQPGPAESTSPAFEDSCALPEPSEWGSFPTGCSPLELSQALGELRKRTAYAPASDRVIAGFSSVGEARAAAASNGWRIADELGGGGVALAVPAGHSASSFKRAVKAKADPSFVQLDHPARAFGQVVDWGAQAVNAPEAHLGGATGAGVVIAVVDTGVDYRHEDLAANAWTNPGEVADNGLDDDGNGYVDDVHGWDFIGSFYTSPQEDDDPLDTLGHGTHVAGIAAAADNGIGVLGVAPGAQVMPVRVLDDYGFGFGSTIAQGIRYAADNGADVINLSLGGYQPSPILRDAVNDAVAAGAAVVAAAGNAYYYSIPSYPAGVPAAISVAAASREDQVKTWWSDFGNVDFIAPGEEVLSSIPIDAYARYSGTSMAAPHVAGALALIKEVHPGFGPVELEHALASTADDRGVTGKDEANGSGFPDAEAATGALPAAQLELYRSKYLIPSDGTETTITAHLLDDAGLPLAGVAGTFSTDVGTLSDTAFVTGADGAATTALGVEDHFGTATVTAAVPGLSRDIRVVVEDDRVRVNDAFVVPKRSCWYCGRRDVVTVFPTRGPVLTAGADVRVNVLLGNRRFNDPKWASAEWSVTDPNGDPVPELAGSSEPVQVGDGFWGLWFSEERVRGFNVTLPDDAIAGRYELTVTVTTEDSGKVDTRTRPFWVDELPEVLLVRDWDYFTAETFNYLDWSFPSINNGMEGELEDLGHGVAYWDTAIYGSPGASDLRYYATVVWLGDWWRVPQGSIKQYLSEGGNILLSAELSATWDRRSGVSTVSQNWFHLTGLYTQWYPHRNHQVFPQSVSGAAGGPFAGETFDIDSTNLGTTGEGTALFTDELLALNAGAETARAFDYAAGVFDPAIGGVSVDDGTYRLLYLGFGIEAINDPGSTMSRSDALQAVHDLFNPAPTIGAVKPDATVAINEWFTIKGTGFQRLAATKVKLGGKKIPAYVVSRTRIRALARDNVALGTADLTVVNPDGDSVTLADGVEVVPPTPFVIGVRPNFASNDRQRTITIYAHNMIEGADVYVGGVPVETTVCPRRFLCSVSLPRGFTPLGRLRVKVVNAPGYADSLARALWVRFGFTRRMERGDRAIDVLHLKDRLRRYGFYDGPLTKRFSAATERALRRYQRDRNLAPTGVLDYDTRRRLNEQR